MFEIIKKIFAVLSNFPKFSALFANAAKTGKIEPKDALNALSSLSPDTEKIANTGLNIAANGGTVSDVANAIERIGEVEILGKKVDTSNLIPELRKSGSICNVLANILEKMKNQTPQEIIEFGNAASDINNINDLMKNAR